MQLYQMVGLLQFFKVQLNNKLKVIKNMKYKNAKKIALEEFRTKNHLPSEVKELTREYNNLKAQFSKLNTQINFIIHQ